MNKEEIQELRSKMTQGIFGPVNRFTENIPSSERVANNQARTIAVNCTFVAGINPLAILEMQEALIMCKQYFDKHKVQSIAVQAVNKAIDNSKL